jgi:putative transposase
LRQALSIKAIWKSGASPICGELRDPARSNPPSLREILKWVLAPKCSKNVAYIEPGSPWENGYCESFNSKLRDELLNGEIFYSLKEARIVIESWRRHYNEVRPHSSLGYKPPAPEVLIPTRPAAQPTRSAGRIRFAGKAFDGQERFKRRRKLTLSLDHQAQALQSIMNEYSNWITQSGQAIVTLPMSCPAIV